MNHKILNAVLLATGLWTVSCNAQNNKMKKEDLKTELCLMLGESEYGSLNGSVVCTWKTSTRSSLDSKRFETEHPALYAKFKKQSTYRTFTIKGAK
jgi:predicted phage-related endonuclease